MILTLSSIIILSLGLGLLFFWLSAFKEPSDSPFFRFSTLVFAVWLISSALWGRFFYAYRIPGFFDITVERILFIAVLAIMAIGLFTGQIDLKQQNLIETYMLLFCIICLISMLRYGFVSPRPDVFPNPWFVFISGYFFPFLIFVFAKNYLVGENDQRFVLNILFLFGSYLAIIAFFEFYGLRQFVFPRFINNPDFPLHLERARGPFWNAGINGHVIVTGFVCGVHLLSQKRGFGRLLVLFLLTLFFPAIFFTQTRSVYLSALIALALLLGLYQTPLPKWKLVALPLALAFLLVSTQSGRLFSTTRRTGGIMQMEKIEIRFELMKRSFLMIIDHPIGGAGLAQFLPASAAKYRGRGTVAEKAEEQTQHFHLLGMAVELGLLGLFSYLAIILLFFRRIRQMWQRIPQTALINNNFLLLSGIVWIVYLNANLYQEPAYFIYYNSVPFLFAGIVDGVYRKYALS